MPQNQVDYSELEDFANQAIADVQKFEKCFILRPNGLMETHFTLNKLDWKSVSLGNRDEIEKIPNNRGIYAFIIHCPNGVFPPHGYVLYIGIAGRRSNRSLRERYKDYLNVNQVKKRACLSHAFGIWHEVIKFFYATIDDSVSSEDLEKLENELNTALIPPCSLGDIDADIAKKRRAFNA